MQHDNSIKKLEEPTNDLNELFKLARFAGSRLDLIQAGGGNISLKTSANTLYIKASGISLSETNQVNKCALVDITTLKTFIEECKTHNPDKHDSSSVHHNSNNKSNESNHNNSNKNSNKNGNNNHNHNDNNYNSKYLLEASAQTALTAANLTKDIKPSIETFFHVYGYKFTLHTHPVMVNALMISRDAQQFVLENFKNALFIDYYTPGIELAIAIAIAIEQYQLKHGGNELPKLIFLKNHGVIISAADENQVLALYDEVITLCSKHIGMDLSSYKSVTQISNIYNQVCGSNNIAYLSCDSEINSILQTNRELFRIPATFPDQYVFNGITPCDLGAVAESTVIETAISAYSKQYNRQPKVLLWFDKIYFMAATVRRAREMEEVFKSHLLAIYYANYTKNQVIDCLNTTEYDYLESWDAEKYRQKL
jgi:rhamnose utilization protein RhaD (predicted bifunctional aldolase and dehydrogenase)